MATTSNAAMRKKTPFHVPILAKQITSVAAEPVHAALMRSRVNGIDEIQDKKPSATAMRVSRMEAGSDGRPQYRTISSCCVPIRAKRSSKCRNSMPENRWRGYQRGLKWAT